MSLLSEKLPSRAEQAENAKRKASHLFDTEIMGGIKDYEDHHELSWQSYDIKPEDPLTIPTSAIIKVPKTKEQLNRKRPYERTKRMLAKVGMGSAASIEPMQQQYLTAYRQPDGKVWYKFLNDGSHRVHAALASGLKELTIASGGIEVTDIDTILDSEAE